MFEFSISPISELLIDKGLVYSTLPSLVAYVTNIYPSIGSDPSNSRWSEEEERLAKEFDRIFQEYFLLRRNKQVSLNS